MNIIKDYPFCRIHKSYIVAVHFVEKIETNSVTIQKNKLPVGSLFKEKFIAEMKIKTNL